MEKGRGRKGKKTGWYVTLGVKDAIFAGVGVVGLMMMSFALGTLAGRGEIYRVAYSMGLLSPESSKVAHLAPSPPVTNDAPPAAPSVAPPPAPATSTAAAPGTSTTTPGATPAAVAAKSAAAAPVAGSIAEVPSSPAPQKTKGNSSLHRQHKAKEEELRKVRQEVASKLKFQNSFDTGPKPPKVSPKQKSADKDKPQTPTLVRVGQYRDSKAAKAKVAELQKKGIKATLKQGKDQKGPLYTVYKPGAVSPPESAKLAHGSPGAEKGGESKRPGQHE